MLFRSGRAAEALAAIGSREDAPAIGQMVARHLRDGALAGIEPDDLRPSIGPPVEAVRLGLFALARLAATDTITGVVLNADGSPVSRWWPVAFTLGRASSPAATQALRALIDTPGRYTSAFAIQALGRLRSTEAAGTLRTLVEQRQRDVAVVVEAVRALEIGRAHV